MVDNLKVKTQQRYQQLSSQNCSLSCGGNLEFLEIKIGERILDIRLWPGARDDFGCQNGREFRIGGGVGSYTGNDSEGH